MKFRAVLIAASVLLAACAAHNTTNGNMQLIKLKQSWFSDVQCHPKAFNFKRASILIIDILTANKPCQTIYAAHMRRFLAAAAAARFHISYFAKPSLI